MIYTYWCSLSMMYFTARASWMLLVPTASSSPIRAPSPTDVLTPIRALAPTGLDHVLARIRPPQAEWLTERSPPVTYPPGDRGRVPQISGRRNSHAKVSHFLTHNDAIAGFTSQSLGLSAYACKRCAVHYNKVSSQNAPILAMLNSAI